MSNMEKPDNELFEDGVILIRNYNWEMRTNIYGLYDQKQEEYIIPCIYKRILSYINGFARVIDASGQLQYVGKNGNKIFDSDLPFIQELCDDFNEDGIAQIGCLADGSHIVTGFMDTDGTMFLKGYNC